MMDEQNRKKTIYKYHVDMGDFTVNMPISGKVLAVQVQNSIPQMWVEVTEGGEMDNRKFVTYGTGHTHTHSNQSYIGTFQMPDYGLVFHLYEYFGK